jgi:CD63 antigen
VILSLVLVLELAAAIAAYSLRGQIADMLDDRLRNTMPQYYKDPIVSDYFDFMQEKVC